MRALDNGAVPGYKSARSEGWIFRLWQRALWTLWRWLLELAGAPEVTVTRAEAGNGGKRLSSQVARSLMLTTLAPSPTVGSSQMEGPNNG